MCQTGSSPLARGLRTRRDHHRGARRIIPARAGFTTARGAWTSCHRDHPRSRGVYLAAVYGAVTGKGSSPLARGLLGKKGKAVREAGIIPARAGFTDKADNRRRMATDHPRSRGVYYPGTTTPWSGSGSSPLARGLRQDADAVADRPGIIPARAGFTLLVPDGLPQDGDHPRSRGVYYGMIEAENTDSGIIPARAGFTARRSRPPCRPRDHPRSRGVYRAPLSPRLRMHGSSPLARGLPDFAVGDRPAVGIIPARAGFTWRPITPPGYPGDHPRSRGVYATHPGHPRPGMGSSPLARGLRRIAALVVVMVGIIPARAGFTAFRFVRTFVRRDHPRSRGVYRVARFVSSRVAGSSPLARGLPPAPPVARERLGIIPARAGFTVSPASVLAVRADHPRSRGVYATRATLRRRPSGSSPLARGLRTGPDRGAECRRIIPARAGFTPTPPAPSPTPTDHPRSRGVYRDRSRATRPPPWIIPARAGFTPPSPRARARGPDHPRSRGVYPCGSLVSQRTRSLPDPRRLHCRPRARSAGSP